MSSNAREITTAGSIHLDNPSRFYVETLKNQMKILFGRENPKNFLKRNGVLTPRLRLCGTNQTQSVHQVSVKVQVLTKTNNEEGCWGEARGWRPLLRFAAK